MIPIILDSTVYKQSPKLNNVFFQKLLQHIKIEKLTLYIPEIIENEFLSSAKEKILESHEKITNILKSIQQYDPKFDSSTIGLDFTGFMIDKKINSTWVQINEHWDLFKKTYQAITLPIEQHHGSMVMNSYFNGDAPFKKVKNREDIPDAFIYASLIDLLKKNNEIIVITQDNNFREKLEKTSKNIYIFSTLSEFFKSKKFCVNASYFDDQDILNRFKKITNFYKDSINENIFSELGSSYIEDNYTLENQYINNAIGEHKDIDYDFTSLKIDDDFQIVDDYSYTVDFTALLIHSVKSLVTREELTKINPSRLNQITEDDPTEDGKIQIIENHETPIKGKAIITFAKTDPSTWEKKKKVEFIFSRQYISEISVEIEFIEIS